MKLNDKLSLASRLLLGLIFAVFGLNGFLHFIPQPPPAPNAVAFLTGMMSTGYFFPLLKGTEVVAGLLLLANVATPLALVLLAPIVVNISFFHAFLAPEGLPLPLVIVALLAHQAWSERARFAPLFSRSAKAKPASEYPPAANVVPAE